MKRYILILFLLFLQTFKGQEHYPLDSTYYKYKQSINKKIEGLNLSFENNINAQYRGKTLKALKKKFKNLNEDLTEKLNEKDFIFDQRLTSISNEILNELKTKNPNIPQNTIILISKNPSLNAYCMPNGIFVLNIGTLYYLETKKQIAAVIAHEISHQILNHSIIFTKKMVEDEKKSKESKEYKTLKKIKYNNSKKAFNLFKNRMYATGGFAQKNEFEADSLAYILLQKTKYGTDGLLTSFGIMEEYDSIKPTGIKEETFRKYFNTPSLPFNEKWLKQEEFSTFNYALHKDKFDKNKISSHPKTKDRIEKLKSIFPNINQNTSSKKRDESLTEIKKIVDDNVITHLIFYEKYDSALYFTLNNLENDVDIEQNKKHLGKILHLILKARKNYKLNRYVAQVNHQKQSKEYAQFLNFIWNLSLDDIKHFADFYKTKK